MGDWTAIDIVIYLFIQGLAIGSLYAMIALGLVLIYRTSDVLNFSHDKMGMIFAFVAYLLMSDYMPKIIAWCRVAPLLSSLGDGLIAGLALAVVLALTFCFAFFFGVLTEFFFLRRAKNPSHIGYIVITIGLWLAFDGAASWIFGTEYLSMPAPLSNFPVYHMGKVPISQLDLIIFAATSVLIVLLYVFFQHTAVGIAMRATFENRTAARLMGIRTRRIFSITWGIGAVLGAMAGILTAARFDLSNTMMFAPFVKSFSAAVLGGLTSIPGAIVGGWIMGIAENFFGWYISMKLKTTFAFLVILAVLLVRPSGLLVRHHQKKV